MATRIYHWKHGWIPLDHEAAASAPKGLTPVHQKHLPRAPHIVAAAKGSRVVIHDQKTGHTATLSASDVAKLHGAGHGKITAVHDGKVITRGDTVAAKAEAAKAVDAARAAEPRLTKAMQALAEEHGGTVVGLDFAVKSEESLARKIESEIAESKVPPPVSAAQAVAKMFDVNRYTHTHPDARYTKSVQATIDALRTKGYTLNVRNYWNIDSNPYRGVNVQVTAPDGTKFELQFHTPGSLAVKEGELHRIYEKQRTEPNAAKRRRYDEQMHAAARKIHEPPGVRRIH